MNQIASIVSKRIKEADEKLKMGSEGLDWLNLKRAPQILKKKVNIGYHTHDTEFDDLKTKFNLSEHVLMDILKYTKMFTAAITDILGTCALAATNLTLLFEARGDELKPTGALIVGALSTTIFSDASDSVTDLLNDFNIVVETRVAQALKPIKAILKQIRAREGAMLDYDLACNGRQSLVAKKTAAELNSKQTHSLFNLERKIAEFKMVYTSLNDTLKLQLPAYLALHLSFLGDLQTIMTGYVSAIISRIKVIHDPLDVLAGNVLHVPSSEFRGQLLRGAEDLATKCAQDFANFCIFSKSETIEHYPLPLSEPKFLSAPDIRYCRALFNFAARQNGDLSFVKNDLITVLSSDGNWWKGELKDRIGIFPANYVTTEVKEPVV